MNVKKIINEIKSNGQVNVTGMDGSSAAFLISYIYRELKRPVLVLSPTIPSAGHLMHDLNYFLGSTGRSETVSAYETLPFEEEAPDPEMAAGRMASLTNIAGGKEDIFISSSLALCQRFIPPKLLKDASLYLEEGQQIDMQKTARHLDGIGYSRVSIVENLGEYSMRGNIMDIFSPGWDNPLRLDLYGDRVEEMKWFRTADQRSLSPTDKACLIPLIEIIGPEVTEVFHEKAGVFSPCYGQDSSPLTRVRRELDEFGVRAWHTSLLPLFYRSPATIFDYCLPGSLIVLVNTEEVLHQARKSLNDIKRRGSEEGYDPVFIKNYNEEASKGMKIAERGRIKNLATLHIHPLANIKAKVKTFHLPSSPASLKLVGNVRPHHSRGWPALKQIKRWNRELTIIFVCRTGGAARRLSDILKEYDLGSKLVEDVPFDPSWPAADDRSIHIHVGELKAGFQMPCMRVAFITEEDLFGPKYRIKERPARTSVFELDFSSLKTGDYLVHEDHGIGLFDGLSRIKVDSREEDMLAILYAEEGRLYVPMDQLYLVQRYNYAKGYKPRLDRIGGKTWPQAKSKAKRAVRTMVREMLRTHAKRQLQQSFAFSPDSPWQKEFEAGFEYEETYDQWRSIEEVKKDMESPRPMDRLVCGDVGYGKTEVAMRAAFKSANDGKQVCLLAPTTVLCQQHYLNFNRRFEPFPMRIEVLSRFTSPKAQADIIHSLAKGTVDIVIGTHRLLQKDIRFHDLGLLIIDEEHRFGVKDKEKLKSMKASVNLLCLSATPIPRTFYMTISGIRDLSVIETPPQDRLGVKTKVLPYSAKVIREAILREMGRGGQIFFLHNRVMSIKSMARFLSSVVPEARIAVAHGQMSEKSLKQVMAGFIAGQSDVLLSTSIIESGLDIPNANTLIINRADRFGLADLYQLRGRIGRSAHQAYAYLMIPAGRLTDAARQRLAAIEEFSELGSGIKIAALDLEIRGAGNLLGYQQSGRMAEVGLEMYTRILEETIAELKGETVPAKEAVHAEILSSFPAFIPESYMPDVNQRLTAYKRLSLVDNEEDLGLLAEELRDIFGHHPIEVKILLESVALRIAAQMAGVVKIIFSLRDVIVVFNQTTPVDPSRILDLIDQSQGSVRLKGPESLLCSLPSIDPMDALNWLKKILLDLNDYDRVSPAEAGSTS